MLVTEQDNCKTQRGLWRGRECRGDNWMGWKGKEALLEMDVNWSREGARGITMAEEGSGG